MAIVVVVRELVRADGAAAALYVELSGGSGELGSAELLVIRIAERRVRVVQHDEIHALLPEVARVVCWHVRAGGERTVHRVLAFLDDASALHPALSLAGGEALRAHLRHIAASSSRQVGARGHSRTRCELGSVVIAVFRWAFEGHLHALHALVQHDCHACGPTWQQFPAANVRHGNVDEARPAGD